MARMWSLKTCLFSLMAVVVTVTIFLISKFQAHGQNSSSLKNKNFHLDPQYLSGGAVPNFIRDDDISAFYRHPTLGIGHGNSEDPNKSKSRLYQNQASRTNNDVHKNIDYPFDEDPNDLNKQNNILNNNAVYKNSISNSNSKVIKSNSKLQKFKQRDSVNYVNGKSGLDKNSNKGKSGWGGPRNIIKTDDGAAAGADNVDNDNEVGAGAGELDEGNGAVPDDLSRLRDHGHWRKTPADAGLDTANKHNYDTSSIVDITCDVNNGKFILECKKDDNEVYVPFSFLHKYFEVFGKISEKDDSKFIWLHSQVKIYKPKTPYNPQGVFTYFENYNVEVRDRVKCVSGSVGVPISTQWDRNGYFYPIQIAQFGLAHYSKYIVEGEPERIVLENGDGVKAKWNFDSNSDITIIPEPLHTYNNILQIQHTTVDEPATLKLSDLKTKFKTPLLVLSWDMKTDVSNLIENGQRAEDLKLNASFTVTMRYEGQYYYLHYVTSDFLISVQENHIYHGLGRKSFTKWQHIIRDLAVDVQKGVSFASTTNVNSHRKSHSANSKSAKKIVRSKLSIESISIVSPGSGYATGSFVNQNSIRLYLDNLTLSSHEHLAQFYQSADWFVSTQDERGGWPIPVRRKFSSDFYPVLESGWYSAMGQGHALSLLSRAYAVTKNKKYADACYKAVENIFDLPGSANGVKAIFMDKYVWYEEYPTTPSTFVLNGFMYALLGLYDVKMLLPAGAETGADNVISKTSQKATDLYDKGLISLKTMLPLFDTGSGTMYDLKHFTVPGISPNPARLDYHVTHINQLLIFASIDQDPIFESTAERWIAYTEGDRAPHN